ncbi:MAG: MarR family winged helix-turn-helix transcriptional regulator [Pseudomonadales bacterium]|nr:MarR family winged helix-turn-helix transcriptional regulator [Pseudomonadales bacterium]
MNSSPNNDIDYGDLPNHLGFHIRRTYTAYLRVFASLVGKRFALKSQQYSILVLTGQNAGITPSAIAGAIEVKRSLIAVLTEDLRQRGFIEIKTSTSDRREKRLHLTKKGHAFTNEIRQVLTTEFGPALAKKLSSKEISTLNKILPKIYN